MPRRTDHDARRAEVADAAIKVITREGLDRTSLQAIARELGETTGVLTYYFANKDELLLFALSHAMGDLVSQAARAARGRRGLARLEASLLSSMPTSPKRRRAWQIWLAFLGQSVAHPKLIKAQRDRYATVRQVVESELAALQGEGLLPASLDRSETAEGILALLDGIGIGAAIRPADFRPDRQRKLIKDYVRKLARP
ncbi:MAG: TetR/AcrR family transcriptional regulator [Gemmatimonadota bacterium]